MSVIDTLAPPREQPFLIEEAIEILNHNVAMSPEEIDWILQARDFGYEPAIDLERTDSQTTRAGLVLTKSWVDQDD